MKNKLKKQEKKQIDALKSLQSSVKQLPAIKDFISKEGLNPEIIYEIEKKLKKKEKKAQADRSKMVYKGYIIKPMILENLKQYMFLVMILKIILLI